VARSLSESPCWQQPDLQLRQRLAQAHPLTAPRRGWHRCGPQTTGAPSSSRWSVAPAGWFRRHRHSARSGSGRNQDRERRQEYRITVVIASSGPHAAALNNKLLRTGRRWRSSPGPARPDRWRQESRRNGSTAAPTHPKPRAILKDRNHFGLLPLQSFTAGEPRQATAIPTARASLALLAVRLGLIRTGVISTRQWRSADRPVPVDLGRSGDQKPRVRRRRSISGK